MVKSMGEKSTYPRFNLKITQHCEKVEYFQFKNLHLQTCLLFILHPQFYGTTVKGLFKGLFPATSLINH